MYAPTLIESKRPLASRGAVEGGMVSFLVHSALIAAAVYGTMVATKVVLRERLVVDIALPREEAAPPPPPEQPRFGAVPTGFTRLDLPATILTEIPPPSRAPFDPTSFAGVGVENPSALAPRAETPVRAAPSDSVYTADLLEEVPVRTAGEAPAYPALLRDARIAGQVVLEIVVDTSGHVEPGSVVVRRSTNRLFEQPALEAVSTWRFRPARAGGTAVRARVQLPVNFVL